VCSSLLQTPKEDPAKDDWQNIKTSTISEYSRAICYQFRQLLFGQTAYWHQETWWLGIESKLAVRRKNWEVFHRNRQEKGAQGQVF
jgi:hypothetical protein